MPKKLTIEEFITKAKEIHGEKYDYSKVKYVNSSTKVLIYCSIHGDFSQTPNKHLLDQGCPKCSIDNKRNKLKWTQEEFISKCRKIHRDKYDYSKTIYLGSNKVINVICPIHGEFIIQANHHIEGYGCKKCKDSKILLQNNKEKNKITNVEEFIIKANTIHQNKYSYNKSIYRGSKEKLIITCPIHGDFEQTPNQHLQGRGCYECGKIRLSELKKTITQEDFINRSNKIHCNKYIYGKTDINKQNENGKVIITCPIHGDFEQTINAHLQGQGCPICKQSHAEQNIMEFLSKNNIEFEYQKRFSWLGLQSLDFYLPKHNIAIECQGRQHFMPIGIFGSEKGFNEIKRRDIKKKQLCDEHSIKILYYCGDKRCITHSFLNTTLYKDTNTLLEEIKKVDTI